MRKSNTAYDIKEGVEFRGLCIEMHNFIFILVKAFDIYAESVKPVITSGSEKAKGRKENSWHYYQQALDFRVSNLTKNQMENIVWYLRRYLGKDYFIYIFYDKKGKPLGLHAEFDPKG